jgi:hypothetical protein
MKEPTIIANIPYSGGSYVGYQYLLVKISAPTSVRAGSDSLMIKMNRPINAKIPTIATAVIIL